MIISLNKRRECESLMLGSAQFYCFVPFNIYKDNWSPKQWFANFLSKFLVTLCMLKRQSSFFTIRVSVRLSDRSLIQGSTQKNHQNCPQRGLNPGPFDHHSNALVTVLAWYVLARRFLKWALFHAPLHILDFGHF